MASRQYPVFAAFFAIALFLTMGTAQAATCYNHDELEAEQGIKIHSELMVIGLTCQNTAEGAALYAKYRQFTANNSTLISGYEDDLIGFFSRTGAPAPEKALHTLRTQLANKISLHAAAMQTNEFCRRFAGRLDKAVSMSEKDLRNWAGTVWPNHPTTKPLCESSMKKASLQKGGTSNVN